MPSHTNSFYSVVERYRSISHSEADKGNRFERLMQAMLISLPPYCNELRQVWLWSEFPYRQSISLHDTGIDLVGLTYSGEYWAVQCKCYRADAHIDKVAVDSFLSTSSRSFVDADGQQHFFGFRLWIDTTDGGFTNHAAESFKNQSIPVQILHLADLAEMPIDWQSLDSGISGSHSVVTAKQVRPHQQEAVNAALEYFKDHDRGKLIMACGTGKTFTALRMAEALCPAADGVMPKVLFLVPSIALLGQTLREWSIDASRPIRPLCICSDSEVSRSHSRDDDSNITSVEELAWPASTDVDKLRRHYLALQSDPRHGMLVVFSTYQSIDCIAEVQRAIGNDLVFDLIICDEAHRTTGVTLKGDDESAFVRVHDNTFIRARRRIYMTATPRLYKESDQRRAREQEAYLCSMDDAAIYGQEFYRLGFGEAVDKNLLSDYKVLILNVEQEDVSNEVQQALAGLDEATQREVDTDDVAKLIGCINALSKRSRHDNRLLREIDPQPMHRAVAFCQNIRTSKAITVAFNACCEAYFDSLTSEDRDGLVHVEADHVDGSMGAAMRDAKLQWLKRTPTDGLECHLLSNVRCLSEGVDVPSLDAVVFLAAKNSQVDVVQSVGRVMRRAEGKKYGYIIIPIVVPSNVDPEVALSDNRTYAVVWDILNALRAHDDRFNALVNKLELNRRRPDTVQVIRPGSSVIGSGSNDDTDPNRVSEEHESYQSRLDLRFEQLQNVIFARMVQKVGSKRYWEQWAADVAQIATKHIEQINNLIATNDKARRAFDSFMKGLHRDINPSVGEAQAVEMLAQHIITQPVFEALFEGYQFAANNPVSRAMGRIVEMLNDRIDDTDHQSLEAFYRSVRLRAEGIDNAEAKQKIVVELYDKFFTTAFPKVKEQLGIVYTPVEVVDFIIHSVEHVLNVQFHRSLNDRKVQIIDPFTGTGTFITRLLQSGIIHSDSLEYKYKHEIFANEIVLLAYYIASVNIENVYHDLLWDAEKTISTAEIEGVPEERGSMSYTPFPGICLTDTFELGEQMYAKQSGRDRQKNIEGIDTPFKENSKRVQRQLDSPITVIIGNPPYSVGQRSANDDAQNQSYPLLEERIQNKYVEGCSAVLTNSMYDSYIKAFRWATDRITDKQGIIAFITNSGWIESTAGEIFRERIGEEFSDIYVINLRGAIRANMGNREASQREGGNIFGILTGVAITILVKNSENQQKQSRIYYYALNDYLSANDKLQLLKDKMNIGVIPFQIIQPNQNGDWINQRNDMFSDFFQIQPNKRFVIGQKSIFEAQSGGVKSNKDSWVYNYSCTTLDESVKRMIDFYNEQRLRLIKNEIIDVDYDTSYISWTRQTLSDIKKNKIYAYDKSKTITTLYRPFSKCYLYFDKNNIDVPGRWDSIIPNDNFDNLIICTPGPTGGKSFSCIITNYIVDFHFNGDCQCFPLYWYEERQGTQISLFDNGNESNKYIRHEAITDFILKRAREQYGGKVQKEDIFYYVYGFLHCPAYRETFANDLKKMLPRLPLVENADDFWAFSKAGCKLADLHLGYEQLPATKDVVVDWNALPDMDKELLYRVEKMRFANGATAREKDRTTIIYNPYITLRNIPLRAYDYVVNGKSAIEWIMERYCDKTDRASGIRNDANQWGIEHGNPAYAFNLLQSIITLSLRTLDIVDSLPKISFRN